MKKAKLILGLIVTAAILCRPDTAVQSAQQAMRLWYTAVAPALFPFLALMPLLTGPDACAGYEKIFAPVMEKWFKLPGSAAPAIIIGMISGSPGGAIGLRRIAVQTSMTKSDFCRVAPIVCGVGPAYLIMGVGLGLFNSLEMGLKLAGIQMLVQIILLFILPSVPCDESVPRRALPVEKSSVHAAVESVLTVCGYMVLFSVIASVVAGIVGWVPGKLVLILADLPSGMAALSQLQFSGRAAAVGMAAGFGGLCIAAQNMDILKPMGMDWKAFLSAKFVQAALCAVLSGLLLEKGTVQSALHGEGGRLSYAFSLLAALILCLPALICLSKKLFLNRRQGEVFSTGEGIKPNI